MDILTFRLEGPLQSWGEHSHWDDRDTAAMPTKSGVVGLLACALGWKRGDPRIADLCHSLRFAVRADRKGEYMIDYQTIRGNWGSSGSHTAEYYPLIQARSTRMKTADGELRPENLNASTSNRAYLADASFLVALSGPFMTLDTLRKALDHPVWSLCLGRKQCIPSVPIIGTIYTEYQSLEEALYWIPQTDRHDKTVVGEIEDENGLRFRSDEIEKAAVYDGSRLLSPTVYAMRPVRDVILYGGIDDVLDEILH